MKITVRIWMGREGGLFVCVLHTHTLHTCVTYIRTRYIRVYALHVCVTYAHVTYTLHALKFVIFKPLSYCFEETIGFDVKGSFARRPMSRLIKPGDITKEF